MLNLGTINIWHEEIGGIIMVKVMAINAGSSSLKFQLINMPSEEVITSG